MDEKDIARINELARKQKEGTLTPEQARLREAYLKGIRRNIRMQLGTYKEEDFQ